jgi:hypothetical protein
MLPRCLRFTMFGLALFVLAGSGRSQWVIDSLRIDGVLVTAYGSGDSLWTYAAPGPVSVAELGDVDGDTYREVVAGTTSTTSGLVICVRNDGTEQWRYQTGTTGVFWPDSLYSVSQLDISDVDGDGNAEIVSASNHATWFPSRLCALSDSGVLRGDYWNPGHAGLLPASMIETDLNEDGIQEIIVDGINYDLGFVRAVFLLEGDSVHGQAPPYFGNGDHGTERWYFTGHNSAVSRFEVANDLDGDGWRDLQIHYTDGQEVALSGSTGSFIHLLVQPPFVDCLDDSVLASWSRWGQPSPRWWPIVHDRQGIFENNGDANYQSGAITNGVFDLAGGFVLESDVYLEVTDLQGCWVSADIGIGETQPASWGGFDAQIRLGLAMIGEACETTPPQWRQHAYAMGYYASNAGMVNFGNPEMGGELFRVDSLTNGWQSLSIVVSAASHFPDFYVGSHLVFTGTAPLADSLFSAPMPLYLGTKSSGFGGRAYHDWIGFNTGGPPPVLEVVDPGWGEEWRIGQADAVITWLHANVAGALRIDLYQHGSFVQDIASGVNVTDGSRAWTVPASVPTGADFQILLASELDPAVRHFSVPFRILPPVIIPREFFDGFDNSDLDPWTLWGSPMPMWSPGTQGRTGLLDNNGDASFASGAVSHSRFDLSGGFVLQSDMLLDFYNLSGCWLGAWIGIADTVVDGTWGGYDRLLEFGIEAAGDGCWEIPEQYRRHSWFVGSYRTDQGIEHVGGADWPNRINADAFDNAWHSFRVRVDSATWIPQFYADENVIYTGSQPLAPSVRSVPHPLAAHGNSLGWAGRAYHDNLQLISLPNTVGRQPSDPSIPTFELKSNFPNPFNQSTIIRYELAVPATVRLSVCNLLGQEVAVLSVGRRPAGTFVVTWDGKSENGGSVSSGVYLCRLQAGTGHAVRKMLLVR